MATGALLPNAKQQFFDDDGSPLAGGFVHTYQPGTLDNKATYQDAAMTNANANPIELNARGEAIIYGAGLYRVILKRPNGATVWDRDNVGALDLSQASGSSLIGFMPGGDGAESRTAQGKLRESVSVFDFIPESEHAAILAGTSTYDCTAAFVKAFNYIQSKGYFNENESPNYWPATRRFTLTGPAGIYCFSDRFVTPENARPNYVNFDIVFPGAVFKALPGYDTTHSLIHMKAAFDYRIEGISFRGFTGTDVIFNDSSLTQNFGGKAVYKDLRFAKCDYGIRHELESVVAVFEQCMTDQNIKRFAKVWRADQAVFRDCNFNWSQVNKADFDGFIEFGTDEYTPTGEAAFPGGGTYQIGRLLVENCMFIPQDTPGAQVRTGWIKLVSGSVKVHACHFGPESPNRPITIITSSVGATYKDGETDLVDTSVVIEDSSCASSFGIVYCRNDYPNYIHLRNIRLNVLDYSNTLTQRYLVTGNASTINAKTSKYNAAVSKFFKFDIGSVIPQEVGVLAIDPQLTFARMVSTHPELAIADSSGTDLSASTTAYFELVDRDYIAPDFAIAGGVLDCTLTGYLSSVPAGNVDYQVSFKGLIEIAQEGADLKIGYTSLYTSSLTGLGAAPSISVVFLNGSNNAESPTVPIATLQAGNYRIRVKATTNLSGNTWRGVTARIRRVI